MAPEYRKAWIISLVILLCAAMQTAAQEEELLKARASDSAYQSTKAAIVGSDAEFTCTANKKEDETDTPETRWLFTNFSDIPTNTSERVYATNVTLYLTNVQIDDASDYVCADNRNNTANVTLIVFTEYSYFNEGMIVVGINGGLILVYTSLSIITLIAERKTKRKRI